MIDYATWCAIRDAAAKHLNAVQIAQELDLNVKTVRVWIEKPYERRAHSPRVSKLDPFKGRITAWLDANDLSAQQVFQRLQESGFGGGVSIVKEYVYKIRPPRREAFLKLEFAPGDTAQVDWGEWKSITVGNTRRRLYFFVMVLAWSRRMYVEFTLSQSMEHFLACHVNAFHVLGVPHKIMVDNLRCAVLHHPRGGPVQYNPRYLDFAGHYGFEPVACAPAKGNEKGRVERGVGYVKSNFLNGMDLPDFAALNPAVRVWMETVADVRLHRETQRRPIDLWREELAHLQSVNPRPFDVGRVLSLRASRQFRVTVDTNHYSVPHRFVGYPMTVKVYPDRICVYYEGSLVAHHDRSYERQQDIQDPDHSKELVTQRHHARDSQILKRFLALSPKAAAYYAGLLDRRGHAMVHVRKIVALADIHGDDEVVRAMTNALEFEAFSSDYVAHVIQVHQRQLPEPSPLVLMRRQDVLDLDLPPPDLSPYGSREQHELPLPPPEDNHDDN